jgi:hypothetical protein
MIAALKDQSAASRVRTDDQSILCGRISVKLSQTPKVIVVT